MTYKETIWNIYMEYVYVFSVSPQSSGTVTFELSVPKVTAKPMSLRSWTKVMVMNREDIVHVS